MSSEDTEDSFRLAGTVIEQRFRVLRPVAEGGFGVVYEAQHLSLETRLAIKVLKTPAEMNDVARAEFIAKFVLEAKTIARIKHPNIVQVLDTGVGQMPSGDRAPWIALEWLDGLTLEDELRRCPLRSPADALGLMRPVFEAVAYAHDEGIAHRDLKPGNVMLVRGKRGVTPKLLDFGIAKLMADGEHAGTGQTRTQSRFTGFSPAYASPEQVGNARTGPWTDVHALALILTEMLCGRPALPKQDMTETLREILSHQRPTPAKFGVDVGAWEAVLQRAAAYKPDQRFATAAAFLAALEATVAQTGPGHPGAAAYRAQAAGTSGPFAAQSGSQPKIVPSDVVPNVSTPLAAAMPHALPSPAGNTLSAAVGSRSVPRAVPARSPGRTIVLAGGLLALLGMGVGAAVLVGRRPLPATATHSTAQPTAAAMAPSGSGPTTTNAAPAANSLPGEPGSPPGGIEAAARDALAGASAPTTTATAAVPSSATTPPTVAREGTPNAVASGRAATNTDAAPTTLAQPVAQAQPMMAPTGTPPPELAAPAQSAHHRAHVLPSPAPPAASSRSHNPRFTRGAATPPVGHGGYVLQ